MTNVLYPHWKTSLMSGDANANLTGTGVDAPYAALVDSSVGFYNTAHQYYSDVSFMIAGTPAPITTPTVSNSIFNGDDVSFLNVLISGAVLAIILFRHNGGANTTWRLVGWLDSGILGLPCPVGNIGTNVFITWPTAGIFQL